MSKKGITRREFGAIVGGSLLAVGAGPALAGPKRKAPAAAAPAKTRVVLVRDEAVLDDKGVPREDVVLRMLDKAVVALTGKKAAADAWRTIVKPDDVGGI